MELKEYLKYYWLEEKYLQTDVPNAFHDIHKKHLTVEQLFSIIEWKNKKFGIRNIPQLNDVKAVHELTEKIFNASSLSDRLTILLREENGTKRRGIKLATASAILTILYPEEFSVYDIRVRKQLMNRGLWERSEKKDKNGEDLPIDITDDKAVVDKYFNLYLSKVQELATKNELSLRDCDRALWAQDWHKDLQTFIDKSRV